MASALRPKGTSLTRCSTRSVTALVFLFPTFHWLNVIGSWPCATPAEVKKTPIVIDKGVDAG